MKKEQLFLLIKSLNKGEKSYFKKFSSRHTAHGNNNYIKLFDAIDKQKEYDEKKLIADLKSETVIKNLSSAKFYLLGLIIKCLTSFHSEEGVDYKIKELMQSIEILGKKNLQELRLTMIDKAKELALKYERYPLLIELLFMERDILTVLSDADQLSKFYETFNTDVKKYAELIVNSSTVHSNRNKMFKPQIVAGRNRGDEQTIYIDTVFKNEIVPLANLPLTFEARRVLISACVSYYIFKNDFMRAYEYSKQALEMWNSRMDMASQAVPKYVVSIQNYLLTCVNACRFEEMDFAMKKLRSIPKEFPGADTDELKLHIFNALHLELDAYLLQGRFTEGIKYIPEIEKGLEELRGRYGKEFEMVTLFNVAYMYFGAGEYKTALRWTRKIIDNSFADVRIDTQTFTRLLNILIYIELEDSDMLEHQLRSTLRFIKKWKRLYKVESLMLNFFKNFLNHSGRKQMAQKLQNLKVELEAANQIMTEKSIFYDFDFLSWVDSKIGKQSFEQVVQQRAAIKQREMDIKFKEYFSKTAK